MESDLGKLFVGGISWDTDEDRLREYFGGYGEVVEAVIMRDRATGRARGFGFVVFADPAVAERVVLDKHSIDGRVVEAKKAVPRDEQHGANRGGGNGSCHGSPCPAPHTKKKIFVGGLPSTITEGGFKKYFDRFGTITDVVVMYDRNTQRPRGFGFIAYDSEDAVGKALQKTFHKLNGKMVEVKRAVPKELSPAPATRSPVGGYGYNNSLGGYSPGHNLVAVGGLGPGMDGRFGSIADGCNGHPPLGPICHGMGMNLEPRLPPRYNATCKYTDGIGYGRTPSPFYNGSPTRYNNLIGCGGSWGGSSPAVRSNTRNIWGDGSLDHSVSPASSNGLLNSRNGSLGGLDGNWVNWGGTASSILAQSGSNRANGNLGYGSDENLGLGDDIYGGKKGNADLSPMVAGNGLYGGAYADLYGDLMWSTASKDFDGSTQLSRGLGSTTSDVTNKNSGGYIIINGYDVTGRQSGRGIAA